MERTLIKDLKDHIGQQVTLKGWLQTLRDQKSMQFLILRDKTGLAQVAHWKKRQSRAGRVDLISQYRIGAYRYRKSCRKRGRQTRWH